MQLTIWDNKARSFHGPLICFNLAVSWFSCL